MDQTLMGTSIQRLIMNSKINNYKNVPSSEDHFVPLVVLYDRIETRKTTAETHREGNLSVLDDTPVSGLHS
jgi:hypothetical protein